MKEKITNVMGTIVNLVLMVCAVALGADSAFAMSVVDVVANGGDLKAMDDAKENFDGTGKGEADTAKADDKDYKTQLNGEAATASHATATDFEEEEIDQKVAQFRPYRFPLEYDITMNAQQQSVRTYHPEHYRSGSAELIAVQKAGSFTISGEGDAATLTITSPSTNLTGAEYLKEYSTVYAVGKGIHGFEGDIADGVLALYVTEVGDSIKMAVLNAAASSDTMRSMTLGVGTRYIVGATAGSESQMIVDPDNYQPVPFEVYLQKKLSNIVFTDEWLAQAKKVPFMEQDLRQNALFNFKRRNARTHWLGKKKRITVNVKENKLGEQFVYFEEGLLRQIPMFYQYGGEPKKAFTPADLNALAKMQFAKDSVSNEARAYCGKNVIEKLLNMDMTVIKNIKFEDVTEAGMKIKRWNCNFGAIDFVHDPTLDDIGYEDFMVIVDIKNAVHYVKRGQREDVQDMKKGTGDIHEAQRNIYSLIDCIALKGYNSILVGPTDALPVALSLGSIETVYSVHASLSEIPSPDNGQVVYLTEADGGFPADTIVEYDAAAKTWKEYEGSIGK